MSRTRSVPVPVEALFLTFVTMVDITYSAPVVWGKCLDNHPFLDAGNVLAEMSSGRCLFSKTKVCQTGTLGHFEILSLLFSNGGKRGQNGPKSQDAQGC